MSSLKLKMHQNPFSAVAPPRSQLGNLRRSPHHLVGWGGEWGHFPSPLDAFGVSILSPSAPRLSTLDLRAYGASLHILSESAPAVLSDEV